MSERDCGKWYCQRAAGFKELIEDVDIKLWPGIRVEDDDRPGLTEERRAISHWMKACRANGFTRWLAAYTHHNGAATHYWVWDPDSRGKYMEAVGPYESGTVPRDIGELHRGRGWQLPLVAIMYDPPTADDIAELKEVKVPYMVLQGGPDVDEGDFEHRIRALEDWQDHIVGYQQRKYVLT